MSKAMPRAKGSLPFNHFVQLSLELHPILLVSNFCKRPLSIPPNTHLLFYLEVSPGNIFHSISEVAKHALTKAFSALHFIWTDLC